MDVVKILCCLFLPPVGAYLQVGVSFHFWLNLVLCILSFGLLGIVHALWLVVTDKKA